jgi:hypothetical protein
MAHIKSNAVKLRGGLVEDENLCGDGVFDDLVVSTFHVGVADGDSPDHSWAGPESTLRQLPFLDVDDGLTDRGVK